MNKKKIPIILSEQNNIWNDIFKIIFDFLKYNPHFLTFSLMQQLFKHIPALILRYCIYSNWLVLYNPTWHAHSKQWQGNSTYHHNFNKITIVLKGIQHKYETKSTPSTIWGYKQVPSQTTSHAHILLENSTPTADAYI